MKYCFVMLLLLAYFGFSWSLSAEYTAERVLEYFSSERFFETDFYEVATKMRPYQNRRHLSLRKIQKRTVFTLPIQLHEPIHVNNELLERISAAFTQLSTNLANIDSDDEVQGIYVRSISIENGEVMWIYPENPNSAYRYLTPVFYDDKFEGYISVGFERDGNLRYFPEPGMYQSFRHKTPFKIGADDAKKLASLEKVPHLYDFSWYGMKEWPEDKLRFLWIGESKAVSATSGDLYEIVNTEDQRVNFLEVEPEITIFEDGTITAALPIKFKLIQEGIYSEDYTYNHWSEIIDDSQKRNTTINIFLISLVVALCTLIAVRQYHSKKKTREKY